MKKLLVIITCAIFVFAISGCTIDLGNNIHLSEDGIVKVSTTGDSQQNGGKPTMSGIVTESASSSKNNTSNGGNVTTSSGGGNVTTSSGGGNVQNSNGGNTQTSSSGNTQTSSGGNTETSSGGGTSGGGQPSGEVSSDIKPLSYAGVSEGAYVTWEETSVSSAKAYYKLSGSSSYTEVDGELIRETSSGVARVDMLGLKAGNYDLRIHVGGKNKDIEITNVAVTAYDRSGYAHFNNNTGVGAYNNDGTLKSGVKVVYITEATKNTANGGIVASLKKSNICIRVIGKITHDTLKSASTWEGKYTKLNGVMEPKSSGSEGTTWGVAEISGVSNLTVEGVGEGAEFFQWGMTFKRCNSIEVRNLTFTDYPEDACGVEGDNAKPTTYKYFWVHNNLFNQGKRLFDDSADQDKKEGDGAIDIKGVSNLTYSYNKIQNCHKTGLVGGSNSNLQCNITFHHNYFYNNSSRMPLGRQANMHYYNNYFQKCSKVYDLRASAYVFSEANYFESCSNPCTLDGGACKSFGDVGIKNATVVTDRTKSVSNTCSFGSTFDVDSSKFYYNSSAKKTNVTYLTDANTAKADAVKYAGPCKANPVA